MGGGASGGGGPGGGRGEVARMSLGWTLDEEEGSGKVGFHAGGAGHGGPRGDGLASTWRGGRRRCAGSSLAGARHASVGTGTLSTSGAGSPVSVGDLARDVLNVRGLEEEEEEAPPEEREVVGGWLGGLRA